MERKVEVERTHSDIPASVYKKLQKVEWMEWREENRKKYKKICQKIDKNQYKTKSQD